MQIEKEQVITAVKGLTRRVNIKQEHLEIIDRTLEYNNYSQEEWEEILNRNNINLALNNKIYTMEMVRLLTLRAIIFPDTIIEYLTWLSEGNKIKNDSLRYSLEFQQQINTIFLNNCLLDLQSQLKQGINLITDELELNEQKLFSKKKNKWFNFLSVYKDELDKIDSINNLLILGFGSAYLPEYVPIISYLYKKFKDTNIKLFPVCEDAKKIRSEVENIFLQGLLCEPIMLHSIDDYPNYSFTLKKHKSNLEKQVNIRRFPRECLWDLALEDKEKIDNYLQEYLDKLILHSSIIFLFNGLSDGEDSGISKSVNYLKNYLSNYRDDLIRIPVIFHHFDHPELYPYKDDMDGFLKQKFPLTQKAFDDWGKESKITIRYFPCSLFGVVNNNGKIESNGLYGYNYCAILKNPEHWKPFGVLSPIYWLLTGRYDPNFLDI